jgi:hypothetical protein
VQGEENKDVFHCSNILMFDMHNYMLRWIMNQIKNLNNGMKC